MPRRTNPTEPTTAPIEPQEIPQPDPEPEADGMILRPHPVNVVRVVDGSEPDPATVFRHVTGNIWEVRARLVNLTYPPHLNGRPVQTLVAHPGQTISGEERARLIAAM